MPWVHETHGIFLFQAVSSILLFHSIHSPEFSNPLFIIIGKSIPAEVDHVQEYG